LKKRLSKVDASHKQSTLAEDASDNNVAGNEAAVQRERESKED
jgi:hypothetical protein